MEQTFITIHNLSPDANILFASDSIIDILGYLPQDVQGRSCFDYFHPDELPFARSVHNRGVLLDKAAVLHYVRIMSSDGRWISCECCFTIVHDVLVASISVYRRGEKSERRAIEAPQIRRIFSSSPRDPRYHMLEHLSPKFKMQPTEREPRAALILNRFTRTLTIMFATNAVSSILGVAPHQLRDKSFYECIAESYLANAVRCLESAKANDSIAYLRFWSRDPRRQRDFDNDEEGDPIKEEDSESESEESESDVRDRIENALRFGTSDVSGLSVNSEGYRSTTTQPRVASATSRESQTASRDSRTRHRRAIPTSELEAVVSCTSDGLVVVLRKARPQIPSLHPPMLPRVAENGLFAAPWSDQSIRPHHYSPEYRAFRSSWQPQYMPLRDEHVNGAGGPPADQLMKSIRDVAVFAWAVVGINGNDNLLTFLVLASFSRGIPRDESQPAGLPIWDPSAPSTSYLGPEAPSSSRWRDTSAAEYSAESELSNQSQCALGTTSYTSTPYQSDGLAFGQPESSHASTSPWPSSGSQTPAYSQVEQHSQVPARQFHNGWTN
ncbi:hypothetical protein F5Y18DRAFT_431603 [Xylariaceae sp. FL1019]|nr:hypothetical protein F5Y18DRAFT_431603 [Xylariaceae sp. FL1019]